MGKASLTAQVAVEPGDSCPFRSVSERSDIRWFCPGRPVLLTVDPSTATDPFPEGAVEEVVETERGQHLRVTEPAGGGVVVWGDGFSCSSCAPVGCVAFDFEALSIRPFNHRWENGSLRLTFAACSYDEFRRAVGQLEDVGFDVDLRWINRGVASGGSPEDQQTVVFSTDQLTASEREAARVAARNGYFDDEGTDATTIAEKLGVSRSTLSKHLQNAYGKLVEEIFS